MQMDEKVKEQVSQKEELLRAAMDEKIGLIKERCVCVQAYAHSEHALQRQVAHLTTEILALRNSNESAQEKLFSKNQRAGVFYAL